MLVKQLVKIKNADTNVSAVNHEARTVNFANVVAQASMFGGVAAA